MTYSWSISGNGSIVGSTTGSSVSVTAGAAGSFTLHLDVTRNGCPGSCEKVVTVPNPTPCALTPPATNPTCGSSSNQYCGPAGYANYQWSFSSPGNDWVITGGQGTECITYTAGVSGPATLLLETTDNFGCHSSCEVSIPCQSLCPGTVGSIASNFNGTAIAAGRYIWFNSIFKVNSSLPPSPVTIQLTNSRIEFTANGITYNLAVPDANITFDPGVNCATTTFSGGKWVTTVPSSMSGSNSFLSGLSYLVPVNLPGGINPVTWSGTFSSSLPGVSLDWKWAAAVYTSFSTNYNALGVKPIDGSGSCLYANSDHAGTPESFKPFVIGGARGGGGSNFTGSLSATKRVVICPPLASALLQPTEAVGDNLPMEFALHGSYPNPFHASTQINFDLPQAGNVRLVIYNLLGQAVRTLLDGDQPAGERSVVWNGTDSSGRGLNSGIYFYRISFSGQVKVGRMILFK